MTQPEPQSAPRRATGGPGPALECREPPRQGEPRGLHSLFTGFALIIRRDGRSAVQKKEVCCFFLSVMNGYNQFIYSTDRPVIPDSACFLLYYSVYGNNVSQLQRYGMSLNKSFKVVIHLL